MTDLLPDSTSRDMGDDGCVLVLGCDESEHRAFETKLFTAPNGATDNQEDYPIRVVLSSFRWQNNSFGVPDGQSDCALCRGDTCSQCKGVQYLPAFKADSTGYDDPAGAYTRVHRDKQIVAAMQRWVKFNQTAKMYA